MMATRTGLVKKTPLEAYSRPKKGGIIAIKLREDDEVVDVVVTKPGDEVVLATAQGMAIRFRQSDVRPMGRNTSGVKGIKLMKDDVLVGMVVADPEATLLTACENGYGKRTWFGPNTPAPEGDDTESAGGGDAEGEGDVADETESEPGDTGGDDATDENGTGEEGASSSARYRAQKRGGKGLRDIKATTRNGPVVGIVRVDDTDEVLMMTARGKIQRIAAREISIIGRNTQGVRVMSLDDEDKLVALVRVPHEENGDELHRPATEPPKSGDAESE
jgi:DNA gyrase subunit A